MAFVSSAFVRHYQIYDLPVTTPSRHATQRHRRAKMRRRPRFPSPHSPTPPDQNKSLGVHAPRSIKVITTAALEDVKRNHSKSLFSGAVFAALVITLHLFTATVFLCIVEGWSLVDALYFAVVIATTVGYGDITPIHSISKIFVSFYAIVSVALIGGLLQSLVERVANAQGDFANNAANRLLYTSKQSSLTSSDPTSQSSNEIILSTQQAVIRAKQRLRATLVLFLGACISGAVLYGRFLQVSYVDLFYFLCVSLTTVGLGDIHPKSNLGKAYAAIWLVLASLGFANLLSQYANLRLKEREYKLAKATLSEDIGECMFQEIDGDDDGSLSEAEFMGYMLCKLGKTTPEEVSLHSFFICAQLQSFK